MKVLYKMADETLPDFSIEYIQAIRTCKDLVQLFRDRPDWKKSQQVCYSHIKLDTLESYKKLALNAKLGDKHFSPLNITPIEELKRYIQEAKENSQNNTDVDKPLYNIPVYIPAEKHCEIQLPPLHPLHISAQDLHLPVCNIKNEPTVLIPMTTPQNVKCCLPANVEGRTSKNVNIPYYLEVKDRLFEDKAKNLLYVAMFDTEKRFTAFAYTNLDNKEIILEHMPFYMVTQTSETKVKRYAKSSTSDMSMHDIIFGEKAPKGYVIDHDNSDGLDNRRENLRLATFSENSHNRVKPEGCSSIYSGVSLVKGKWRAAIAFKGETYNLGKYDNEEDAAKIRDVYAVHFYKDIAHLNTKDGKYFLTQEEVADIYENGIPKKYKIKKKGEGRDLPKNITKRYNKWRYKISIRGIMYIQSYDSLEEAVEGLRELIEQKDEEEKQRKREIENNIVRNDKGVAILYTHDKDGNTTGEWRVNDNVWQIFIHDCWYQYTSNGATYAYSRRNGVLASLHVHTWITFKGPVPEGMTVDHINSKEKDDCTFENLRLANKSLQSHNQISEKTTIARFKGISIYRGNFVVTFRNKQYGTYYYEEDAVREYNKRAIEYYKENANLIPEPRKTRTTVADYYSNLSIEFISSLGTAGEIAELFYLNPNWGVKYNDVTAKNFKNFRDIAIKIISEQSVKGIVEEPVTFPKFTSEYIRSIKTVTAITKVFRDRPDWKQRHRISFSYIYVSNLEEYKDLALQSIHEEFENFPANNDFKPIVSKIVKDEEKFIKVGTEEDISNIKLPAVADIKITPMKALKLAISQAAPQIYF